MPEGDRSVKAERERESETPIARNSQSNLLSSRYEVYGEIAAGGMASVQYGRLLGPRGFSRAVAIKRLHAHYSKDPDFVSMFLDEARLSARLVHANIIHTLDVIETPGEVALVMEYVHGESLWTLLRMTRAQGRSIPVRVGCALIASVLHGLHAAHDACDDTGEPLHIVHRDVSPQNILIGSDGIPRVLDFGIAKALGRLRTTPQGEIKGKLGYIAQEQLHAEKVDRRTDVYGAAAVLWEVLTGAPLFDGPSEPAIVHRVLYEVVQAPSRSRAEVPAALDAIVLRALSRDPAARHETAQQMALQIERDVGLATQSEVAAWLYDVAGARLAERAQLLAALQEGSASQRLQSAEVSSSTRKIEPGAAATKLAPAPTLIKPVESANGAKRSRRGLKIASAVALSVVCALALFAAWQARPVVTAPRPPLTAASNAMATVAATQESLEQPVTSQPPAAESAPAPNAEKPKLLRAVKRTKPTNPAPPARSVPSKTTPDDKHCALFYDVDANGIRRPKPECL